MLTSLNDCPIHWDGPRLAKRFSGRVQKISLHVGMTCPNRDGSKGRGGCSFCHNRAFSPATRIEQTSVGQQIERALAYSENRQKKQPKLKGHLAYFQSYSNTYAEVASLRELYGQALAYPEILGICIGTRPDCVNEDIFELLAEINQQKPVFLELGIESIFDQTLALVKRGHDFSCTVDAIQQSASFGLETCGHLMLGFPWETREQGIETAKVISQLPITSIKIHQLQVLKHTQMGSDFLKNPFPTLSKNEYMDRLTEFLIHLNPHISVQRLFAHAPHEWLLSEKWPENTGQLNQELERRMRQKNLFQGKLHQIHS